MKPPTFTTSLKPPLKAARLRAGHRRAEAPAAATGVNGARVQMQLDEPLVECEQRNARGRAGDQHRRLATPMDDRGKRGRA
jgi:hypothetical protein